MELEEKKEEEDKYNKESCNEDSSEEEYDGQPRSSSDEEEEEEIVKCSSKREAESPGFHAKITEKLNKKKDKKHVRKLSKFIDDECEQSDDGKEFHGGDSDVDENGCEITEEDRRAVVADDEPLKYDTDAEQDAKFMAEARKKEKRKNKKIRRIKEDSEDEEPPVKKEKIKSSSSSSNSSKIPSKEHKLPDDKDIHKMNEEKQKHKKEKQHEGVLISFLPEKGKSLLSDEENDDKKIKIEESTKINKKTSAWGLKLNTEKRSSSLTTTSPPSTTTSNNSSMIPVKPKRATPPTSSTKNSSISSSSSSSSSSRKTGVKISKTDMIYRNGDVFVNQEDKEQYIVRYRGPEAPINKTTMKYDIVACKLNMMTTCEKVDSSPPEYVAFLCRSHWTPHEISHKEGNSMEIKTTTKADKPRKELFNKAVSENNIEYDDEDKKKKHPKLIMHQECFKKKSHMDKMSRSYSTACKQVLEGYMLEFCNSRKFCSIERVHELLTAEDKKWKKCLKAKKTMNDDAFQEYVQKQIFTAPIMVALTFYQILANDKYRELVPENPNQIIEEDDDEEDDNDNKVEENGKSSGDEESEKEE